ncbi:3-phosphoshikimate 1-carboxyvinyltransferase [Allocatelliglobosispora scoriae]|uniref:3-phosphoshikimate 1-carboxyvinyltransferase n=1 Tax=Allocatelliglobosispora scoriae TaxID=643052 RepID=A0A841BXW5_9ACTN|nr:3-phosphoshikimate 1-carboxyvinyltransferase [Allocatelliglobosispora scoriae]MBB5871773.1 3-phosphoshikimate 1-carboxyvinyltransferase [Allocatelliglobosispora scoriae]
MTKPPAPWNAPTATTGVNATVRLPGSKSMTARALVLGAGSVGPTTLAAPLRARDTELMAAGIRAMGAAVSTVDETHWVVRPRPLTGPATVDVGLAGTVMRFLPPLAGLATGPVTFDGDPRARQRPLAPLINALRALGCRIEASSADGLPLVVHGEGRVRGGEVVIDASLSSQLVSGLLLAAPDFDEGLVLRHEGPPVPSAPHLRMTVQMLRAAGAAVDDSTPNVWHVGPGRLSGRGWEIEPDLSGAAPFLAAALVTGGSVTVPGWPRSTTQAGDRLRDVLTRMGGACALTAEGLTVTGTGTIHGVELDLRDFGELTPAIAALAALADSPTQLTGISHIRTHETDRVAALAHELTALGAEVSEHSDGLSIRPRPLTGTAFETYDDHRMAHAAAIIGLRVPGVVLSDVSCTSKTLPDFPALWSRMTRES